MLDKWHQDYVLKLVDQIHQTKLFQLVKESLVASTEQAKPSNSIPPDALSQLTGFGRLELATVFLYAQPLRHCHGISVDVQAAIADLCDTKALPEELRGEVNLLFETMEELAKNCCKIKADGNEKLACQTKCGCSPD